MDEDPLDSPDDEPDPVTAGFLAAVVRVRRLLRSSWDPAATLVADATDPTAYEWQAREVTSLAWGGETPEFIANYLSTATETDARPRLARSDLVSLARAIIRLADASRPSA